jgi:cytochrome c oxidase subunit I+III
MRIQLGTPENTFLDPQTYNQIFTMHGTTMMFLFVIPFIEAIANYLIPLIIGTRDLPFPRMTALSYWTYLFGGIFLYSSFLFGVAPDGGWFAYVPLNSSEFAPGINMDFWDIGLSVAEIAALGAAAELAVGILRLRAPGMALHRLPIFAWAMLVTAFMIVFAFTPLIVGTAMLELDRKGITAFFDTDAGGSALLWQHLFWVFGHPEVYIMFLPAVGIVSHVVQTFSRRPIVSYPLVVLAILATGFLSFGLWVHHMFTTGLSPVAMSFFTAASLAIAIPTGVQIWSWVATLWTGRPVWRTSLLFVLGFLVILTLGGLTGVMLGSVSFDSQVHDSYFVVAHFHYVLIGGVLFPLFAGLYYWLPKITGRLLDERLGRWNAGLMFVFFNVAFFPMHVSGLLGMPRRVYTYPTGLGWDTTNLISTIGAFGFAAGVLLFVANVVRSLRSGPPAGDDPWEADGLEWSESSPPASAQFPRVPVVRSRHPLWEQASLEPEDPELERVLRPLAWGPETWRGAVAVAPLDGRPVAVVHMPSSTIWPFVMAVSFLFLFAAALLERMPLLLVGAALGIAALNGWFRPMETERRAVEEIGTDPRPDRLPLAVAGPASNGWWATLVLILVLGTALVTLLASYVYLLQGPYGGPGGPPGGLLPAAVAAGAMAAALAVAVWLQRRLRIEGVPARAEGAVGLRRVALGALLALALVALGAGVQAWRETGVAAAESAYGSIVLGLLGFQWLVLAVLLVAVGIGLAWAWRAPADPRGHAPAWNASLLACFVAASGVAVFVALHLVPRLG